VGIDVTAFKPGDAVVTTFIPKWMSGAPTQQAVDYATRQASQRIGTALGLALLSTVSTSRAAARLSQLDGVSDAERIALTAGFGAAAIDSVGFAIVGLLVALFVVRETDCRGVKAQIVE
jgi:hypothetical protein